MIRQTKRFGLLVIQMAALFWVVAGFGLWTIYQKTLQREKEDLAAIASRNISLINVISKNNSRQEVLKVLRSTYLNAKIFNNGEELWIAEIGNNQLVCLAIYSWQERKCFKPLEVSSNLAMPMRKALNGESGTTIALDYRGNTVVAAYQAIPKLNWGMVVKADLATVQTPFLWVTATILAVTIGGVSFGLLIFLRVNSPALDSWNYVVKKNKFLRELQQERNFIINILEHTDNIIIVLDSQFNIILFNKTCEVITHYSPVEIINQNFINIFIVPEEKEEIIEILKILNETKQPLSHTNFWQTKEGEKRLISWKNTPILDKKGEVSYFIKNGIDITEKVIIEKALLESQSQFKTMFEKANIGMALLDIEGKVTDSNKALQYILYYSESQLLQQPFINFIYHQKIGDFSRFYQEFIDGNRDYFQVETACLSQDKQIIWVQLVLSAVRTDENQFKFAVVMIEDISLRKEAEKAKAELTSRNQSLVAALGEIVYRHDLISDFIEGTGIV